MSTFLIIVVLLIAALLVSAATRPDTFHIERSTNIAAAPENIFPLINDFTNWDSWSPWAGKDPNMKTLISDTTSGQGASYAWEGNKQVGAGSMTIIDSSPPEKVGIQLNFIKPFKAQNTATFTLAVQGEKTSVTWALDGPQQFMNKLMGLFMNMDRMVGKDFETGLASMKSLAENERS